MLNDMCYKNTTDCRHGYGLLYNKCELCIETEPLQLNLSKRTLTPRIAISNVQHNSFFCVLNALFY
jgi:hypothetical protein